MNKTARIQWSPWLISLLLASLAATARGGEANHTYRVLGLFQADREVDLAAVVQLLPEITLTAVDHETGQASFRYDAEKLFPGKTAEQCLQALNQQIRQLSRSTFEITPLSGVDRSQLECVKIEVVGLDCKGCSYAAYLAIYNIEGVENATASFKTGKVVAWIAPHKTNRMELLEALEKKQVKLSAAK